MSRRHSSPSSLPRLGVRASRFLLAEQDALRMRIFECLFTASFLLWMGRNFLHWREWLTEQGFHLNAEELRLMGYPPAWPLLEPWQVVLFGGAILVSSTALFLNCGRRAALAGLFLCALYAQGVDYMAAFTLNKLFVGVFAILAIAPAMVWERAADGRPGRWRQSAAPLRVIQATLILQYFAAGLAKAEGDWLQSSTVLWSQVQGVYRTETAAWALRHLPPWAWAAQQHAALALELGSPLLFTLRRLRPLAFLLGIGFHLVVALMMKDLIFFSAQMWAFYALFITSEEWRAIGRRAWSMRTGHFPGEETQEPRLAAETSLE